MKIVLNGEEKTVREPLTVAGLLADLDIDEGRVVVERNLHIVPRDEFGRTSLEEGDRLELLNLVSGG
jgi:thiamine biosynthesis protein ThiS